MHNLAYNTVETEGRIDITIRITGGIVKGKKIKALDTLATRPTLSRVKTSLFDILRDKIKDATVLDLYSGTGNIGIEALSRGAKYVVFVDNAYTQVNLIKRNLETVGFLEIGKVIKKDVIQAIYFLNKRRYMFDIIYMAPPFLKDYVYPTLQAISNNLELLAEGGIIGVEHHKKEYVPNQIDTIILTRQRRYGDIMLSFYNIEDV